MPANVNSYDHFIAIKSRPRTCVTHYKNNMEFKRSIWFVVLYVFAPSVRQEKGEDQQYLRVKKIKL